MANDRPVRDAVSRLMDPAGLRLGAWHITVSTVGLVPGIGQLVRRIDAAFGQLGLEHELGDHASPPRSRRTTEAAPDA